MLIPVPPRDTYNVEPGRYRATCIDIREIEDKHHYGQKLLRIVWELSDLPDENVRYLVGKNYEPSLAKDSTLRHDLRSWFGHDINVRQFDTSTLKDKDAIVTVQHIENEGRPKPYCWVAKIEPAMAEDNDDTEPTVISPRVVCG